MTDQTKNAARERGAGRDSRPPAWAWKHLPYLCAAIALLLLTGCHSSSPETSDIQMDLTLEPSPPAVGEANVLLSLADAQGEPVEGADVRVEGNMNHAGMKPSFAEMTEREPGEYAGTLDFTMGGDWFLLVTATTPDGRSVERKIDVPGVESQ